MTAISQYPHCDSAVLHAPNECDYCDKHPDWQELRETWAINFTGHTDKNKSTCPSEQIRSVENINRWPGNRPSKEMSQ